MPSEQTRKRRQNQRDILDFLRRNGPAQRSYLSTSLEIRKSSVTSICQELLQIGALREIEPGAFRSPLGLAPDHWSALAVDLQPGRAIIARVNASGDISDQATIQLQTKTPQPVIDAVTGALALLIDSSPAPPCGIGVSFPGLVDSATGVAIAAVNLDGWEAIELAKTLSSELQVGVAVENDATCELLGNCWFKPWGPDLRDVLYISIHDGIGCSQLVGGEVARGTHSAAGEIGCLKAGDEGRQCACGKTDCLQTYCSAPAIAASLKAGTSLGDTLAPLTSKLATAVSISDPEALIVAADKETLIGDVQPVIATQLRDGLAGLWPENIPVHPGFPCPEAALLGAAASAFSRCFSEETLTLRPEAAEDHT